MYKRGLFKKIIYIFVILNNSGAHLTAEASMVTISALHYIGIIVKKLKENNYEKESII